jgi:hypothetical protein
MAMNHLVRRNAWIRILDGAQALCIALALAACGDDAPSGVDCAAYEPCPALDGSACPGGVRCMAAPGCETAICISDEEWYGRSCPEDASYELLESFPPQPRCGGMVSGTPKPLDPLECPEVVPWEGRACTHDPEDDCLYEAPEGSVQSCRCSSTGWTCASDPLIDESAE